jgi:hypothetical protein
LGAKAQERPLTPKDVLNRVVDNAFTYLEKGLTEVDSEINFSLLHFYGGVELAIKACLLNEDWRLVIQEPSDARWNTFCQGKQRTVGLDDAAKRLSALKSKPIDQQTLSAFGKLRIHRNQLTHFFHSSLNTLTLTAEKEQVARELLIAWYYLHRLVQDPSWARVFHSVSHRIAKIDVQLQALSSYLQAIFDAKVKTNSAAASFLDCPACHYKALNPQTGDAYFDSQCLVCGFKELSHRAVKHGEEIIQGHCLSCGEENCVEPTEYGARCTACGESFTHITTCDFCGESFAGANDETEGDYQTGCPFCDGKLGYLMDKND